MKILNCLSYSLLIIFISLSAYASDDLSLKSSDDTTNSDIEKFPKLKQSWGLISKFSQVRHIVMSNRNLKSSGSMLLLEDGTLCWNVTDPFKKIWQFTSDKIIEVSDKGIIDVGNRIEPMIRVLTDLVKNLSVNNLKKINNSFELLTEELTDGSTMVYLSPIDDILKNAIHSIDIKVTDGYISSIKINELSGSYTLMNFDEIKLIDKQNDLLKEERCFGK